ncbi:porin family protein [Hydrogenimonas thermophila]|uniref:Tetratricopeptide repeat-containing protein n=1 Tax=Hydrogenimonas thermophila TaxID=223786 RepID=A0A1I5P1Z0_9BACT|nr:porin family protein [Hydrogenimonas thermophila]SFP28114.1 Tetratricopeptide repeat-containing protein [Hydrogenimonas thermophila]
MKKIFILLLFYSILNAGNNSTELHSSRSNLKNYSNINKKEDQKLKRAIYYYKNGKYEKSYEVLNRYLLNNLKNIKWQYYLGRSAYKLGKFEEAISAFERVLMLEPTNIRAKLEIAKIYFETKKLDKSKNLFEEILKENIPVQVKLNVKKYLKAIEKSRKKSFLKAIAVVGISYDSNVNNSPVDEQYYIPKLQINLDNTVTYDSDYAHQEILILNHLYDIGNPGGFALKNNFLFFLKTMEKYSDKNIFFYSYSPAISYRKNKYLVDLAIGYERMFYGSNPYLHTFYFSPSLQYMLSKTFMYKISLKFQRKIPESLLNKERDANFYEIFLSIQKKLSNKFFINPTISYQQERKIDSVLTNIDLDAIALGLGTVYKFTEDKSFGLKLLYRDIKYKDIDSLYGTKRKDRYYNFSISFTKKMSKGFIFQGSIGHIKNYSNHPSSAYKKSYANINIIKEF